MVHFGSPYSQVTSSGRGWYNTQSKCNICHLGGRWGGWHRKSRVYVALGPETFSISSSRTPFNCCCDSRRQQRTPCAHVALLGMLLLFAFGLLTQFLARWHSSKSWGRFRCFVGGTTPFQLPVQLLSLALISNTVTAPPIFWQCHLAVGKRWQSGWPRQSEKWVLWWSCFSAMCSSFVSVHIL